MLPPTLDEALRSITVRSDNILSTLQPRISSSLKTSTKESRLIAYRKMIEMEFGVTLPRSVLRVRKKTDPYGFYNTNQTTNIPSE